jgi:uncharacterized protein YuzE
MKPNVEYHADDNATYIRLSRQSVLDSAEVALGVVFDYDADGRIVSIEVLDTRAQLAPELLADAVDQNGAPVMTLDNPSP